MGNQRHAKEQVDELDLSVVTFTLDRRGKILISDVHDRIGSILSDRRTGVERYLARYFEGFDKEWYPVGSDVNINGANPLNLGLGVSTAAPINVFQPDVGFLNDIEFMYIEASVFAAPRQLIVRITDGVNVLPIWNSGPGALASGMAGLIHPTDETGLGIFPGTRNTFRVWNGSYLEAEAIGFAPGEFCVIHMHNVPKDIGGLRE